LSKDHTALSTTRWVLGGPPKGVNISVSVSVTIFGEVRRFFRSVNERHFNFIHASLITFILQDLRKRDIFPYGFA